MNAQPKLYLTRAGKFGEDEDAALDNGIALIRFDEVPSLEDVNDYDNVAALVANALPNAKPRAAASYARQLWTFAHVIAKDDLVVLPRKQTSQVAIGRVTGPYQYKKIGGEFRHSRPVKWERPDVPRTAFEQDLLYSFGAFMTVCQISRHDAARRVAVVLAGKSDPGPNDGAGAQAAGKSVDLPDNIEDGPSDLAQAAHDQIVKHIQSRFPGHALSALVAAVLRADGWITKESPPGPDGGVDILGGRGPLGLDPPRLCVQVKSQNGPADVAVYRTLQGSMQTFNAQQGLLVCWGGFNKPTLTEARQGHFTVRLWDANDLVTAIYRTYDKLPEEIQTELPLKRVWTLVPEDEEA
jgi:restriction system protein